MNDRATGRPGNLTDLIGGGVMLAICAVFVLTAMRYGVGTPARMGPGFFPFAFGLVGIGLALVVIVRSFFHASGLNEKPQLRALAAVATAVVSFGLLIETAGLVPAVFVSTLISAYADNEARWRGSLLLALGLSAAIAVIFVYLLGLPIPLIQGFR